MERLLSTAEVAELLGVAPETVRFWRWNGSGPPAHKVGRLVRYQAKDVQAWVDARQRIGTGGEAA